ncbi:NAD(P)-binding protein [Trichodelitschia bisporula]|uniref:NAD(P)-binding protein n=1 Tax=Trichodelitschia bisporula TaxID=703511 RepID=A0A6G1I3E5_9PEZI|nr:NAD(P)-binding protein [Trichodelitschia bisporula]
MTKGVILVTGANGFIAGHIIDQFLAAGYTVRGTVRSPSSGSKVRELHAKYGDKLEIAIVPDLTKVESYENALQDVVGIMHTASPVDLSASDNEKELLIPAIQGVTALLKASKKWATSLKRIVFTSSFAANINVPEGYRPGYTYTSEDWNPVTYAEGATADPVSAYCASKTLAEQAAWSFIKEEKPSFDLVSLNPAWVFGPHFAPTTPALDLKHLNESTQALWKVVDADTVPPVDFAAAVDVRDVARAHLLAFETPAAGGNRFLLAEHFSYQLAADIAREQVPELAGRVPVIEQGKEQTPATYYAVDGSKPTEILGLKYRPITDTIRDAYAQLAAVEKVAAAA